MLWNKFLILELAVKIQTVNAYLAVARQSDLSLRSMANVSDPHHLLTLR